MFKNVLVPLGGKDDHGEGEKKAIRMAREICSGEIILLHVMEPIVQTVGGEDRLKLEGEMKNEALRLLDPYIRELKDAGARFHASLVFGTVAESIVQTADKEQADLIVMFTDGDDNLTDMFLGTITERVLRNTGTALLALRQ